MNIFTTIFYQPIYNLLIWLYNVLPGGDVGWAIVVLTVIIKAILFPFTLQQLKSQRALSALQPKIEELKAKYKDQKDRMMKEMMALYKSEKVNPFSSCLPLVIQLPFLWAVYRVFIDGLNGQRFDLLYPFVARPETIHVLFLGFIDLAKPSIPFAVLAGAAQWWQTKMLMRQQPPKPFRGIPGAKDENVLASMNKQMMYIMPAMTVLIGATLPGGLSLYWLVLTLLTVAQQHFFLRKRVEAA